MRQTRLDLDVFSLCSRYRFSMLQNRHIDVIVVMFIVAYFCLPFTDAREVVNHCAEAARHLLDILSLK